jgi:spermidine synthase
MPLRHFSKIPVNKRVNNPKMKYKSVRQIMMIRFAVFFSGVAGLCYQVAWTRRIASVTSATATSQAVVLAIFMAGLGLGSGLASRRAPKSRKPLRTYALIEIVALLFALLSPTVLSSSEAIRTITSQAGFSLSTGMWLQLLAIAVFLLLPTTLLGASLPFVIEHVEQREASDAPARGRIIGVLYAFNTFGAAAGTLLSGFVTIEHLGLSKTIAVGAGFAAVAALISLILEKAKFRPSAEGIVRNTTRSLPWPLLALAALGGCVGLAGEVLWTRLISLITPNTVYAYSQVLFAVLLGIALGAWISERLSSGLKDHGNPAVGAQRLVGLCAALSAVLLATVPVLVTQFSLSSDLFARYASGDSYLAAALITAVLVAPSALIATILPLLVVVAKDERGSQSFGELYAANTVGSVLGTLGMGFILLPVFGTHVSGVILEILCILIALICLRNTPQAKKNLGVVGLVILTCITLEFSHGIPIQIYQNKLPQDLRILDFSEGVSTNVMVSEHKKNGQRRLWLNSDWVAGTGGTHRALGHLPALMLASPKRILGIALGTGQTFAAALNHGAESLDCVEINSDVISLSRKWFAEANRGLLDSPKVNVHNDDGRAFLRATEHTYDLIILEPLQAWTAGTSNLYSIEFYREAKTRLTQHGVLAQWIPFYGQTAEDTKVMVKTALEVFEHATLWIDGYDAILIASSNSYRVSIKDLRSRINKRGIANDIAQLDLNSNVDLAALFMMDRPALQDWTKAAPILSDDRPFLEFRAARTMGQESFESILSTTIPHLSTSRGFFTDTTTTATTTFSQADSIRNALLKSRLIPKNQFENKAYALEAASRAAHQSRAWNHHYREHMLTWAKSLEQNPEKAKKIYERALRRAPNLARLRVNLAILYIQDKNLRTATKHLIKAKESEEVRPIAQRILMSIAKHE